jgi:hypothetical protein
VAYTQILGLAEAAGLNAEEVGKVVGKWVDEAKAYGPEWMAETGLRHQLPKPFHIKDLKTRPSFWPSPFGE